MSNLRKLFLGFALIATGLGSAMAQNPTIEIQDTSAAPGSQVTLDITFTAGTPDIASIQYFIAPPTGLTLGDLQCDPDPAYPLELFSSCATAPVPNDDALQLLVGPDTTPAALNLSTGRVATLTFTVPATAQPGDTFTFMLEERSGGCFDTTGANATCDTLEGVVTVTAVALECTLNITTAAPLSFMMSPQTLTASLENAGNGDCTGITPTVTGTGYALDAGTTTCTATLTPTGTCDIGITFSGTLGDAGELSVASNDADSPDLLALTSVPANGGGECSLEVTTPTFTMSPQTLSATVNNTGDADCTGITPTVTGAGYAQDAATTTCTATLAPTGTCDIGITFSGTLGDAGQLSVASNDPNTPTVGQLASTAAPPVAIPTLSQWSMILVGAVLAMLAMFGLRRKEG